MKKTILVLIIVLMIVGVNAFADDVEIDSDGNITTGLSSSSNLEVIGSSGEDGIVGSTSGTGASGVIGENTTYGNLGILGGYFDTTDVGVYGYSSSGYAGYFQGNVRITGDLTVNGTLTLDDALHSSP